MPIIRKAGIPRKRTIPVKGKAVRRIRKELNSKQAICHAQLKKCLAEHKDFVKDARDIREPSILKRLGTQLSTIAAEAGKAALEASIEAQSLGIKQVLVPATKRLLVRLGSTLLEKAKKKLTPKTPVPATT